MPLVLVWSERIISTHLNYPLLLEQVKWPSSPYVLNTSDNIPERGTKNAHLPLFLKIYVDRFSVWVNK